MYLKEYHKNENQEGEEYFENGIYYNDYQPNNDDDMNFENVGENQDVFFDREDESQEKDENEINGNQVENNNKLKD